MESTFPDHPGELGLVSILRRWIQGDAEPWIYEADVYSEGPMSLTAKYPQATAENGDPAWYFVSIPRKKEGNGSRMSRVAGPGTWKQDRSKSLSKHGREVGWGSKFSFMLKTKTKDERDTRVGWIMNSVRLIDGEDPLGRCLHKIYPTPRPKAANPQMSVMSPAEKTTTPPQAAQAEKTVTPPQAQAEKTVTPPQAHAEKTTTPPQAHAEKTTTPHQAQAEKTAKTATTPQAQAEKTAKTATTPQAQAEKTAKTATTPQAQAEKTAKTATPPQAQAEKTSTPQATGDESPPRKWVHVLISGSPTKARDLSSAKRVFGVLLPEEDAADPPAKRMKVFDCKGWLTIEPAK